MRWIKPGKEPVCYLSILLKFEPLMPRKGNYETSVATAAS